MRRLVPLLPGAMMLGLAAWPAGLQAQQPVGGRVLDAMSGAPVAQATLTLTPEDAPGEARTEGPRSFDRPGLPAATTGPDGSFRFAAVPPGRYRLTAARRGYLAASLDQHGSLSAAVVVVPGAATQGVRFALEPDATMEGQVQDSSGDPVRSGTVTLFRVAQDGSAAVRAYRTAGLRGEGDSSPYRFSDLPPGTYYLAVTATPWFSQPGSSGVAAGSPLDLAYPLTYYDGAASAANAEPIALTAGEAMHADVTLQAVPAVHLRLDMAGGGAMFPSLTQQVFGSDLGMATVMTVTPGSPEGGGAPVMNLAVAPGSYQLNEGGSRRNLTLDADADTAPEASGQASPVTLSGQLAMADGQRLPAGLSLTLMTAEDGGPASRGGGQPFEDAVRGLPRSFFHHRPIDISPAADGRFQTTAPPGEYRLEAEQPDGAPLLVTGAAASGATLSPLLTLTLDTGPAMLAATLAVADSSLRGTVGSADGAPEPGVMILLVPSNPGATALYRQAESATDGSWVLTRLPAGSYRVLAIRNGWDLAWQTPSVLVPYLKSAATVTLQTGQAATLPGPLTIHGR